MIKYVGSCVALLAFFAWVISGPSLVPYGAGLGILLGIALWLLGTSYNPMTGRRESVFD
jgi:hypothetical protein